MTFEYLEPSPDGTWREAEAERRMYIWFADPRHKDRQAMWELQSVRFRVYGDMRLEILREEAELERQYPDRVDEIRLHYGLSLGPASNSAYSTPPEAIEHKSMLDEWIQGWNERDRAIRGFLE